MKNALAFSVALIVIAVCAWQASVATLISSRLIFVSCALLVAFAVGVGVGERAHGAFSRALARANKLLSEQNRDLCEMNATLIEREANERPGGSRPHGAKRTTAAN